MDNLNTSIVTDCKHLASIWLQQQDLSGKSPTEVSDMYFKALQEIWDNYKMKYAPKQSPRSAPRVVNPGLQMDEW